MVERLVSLSGEDETIVSSLWLTLIRYARRHLHMATYLATREISLHSTVVKYRGPWCMTGPEWKTPSLSQTRSREVRSELRI